MNPPEQPVILYKQGNGEPGNNNFKVEAAAGENQNGRHCWSVISSTQVRLPESDDLHILPLGAASYEAHKPDPEMVEHIAKEAIKMTKRLKDAVAQDRFTDHVSDQLERSDELNSSPPGVPFQLDQRRLLIAEATMGKKLVDLQPIRDEVRRRLLELGIESDTETTGASAEATPEPQVAETDQDPHHRPQESPVAAETT